MTIIRTSALAALFAAGACTTALAAPGAFASGAAIPLAAPLAVTPVVNGYGPTRYGLYGHRHRRYALPNGTGYRGRGTRTGGPSGGLPGRS